MRLCEKIKRNGLKKTCEYVYKYSIDQYIIKFLKIFIGKKTLKNIIIIESHNDFDCNGGAFYDYLIQNAYNKTYKIVWVLKHPERKPKQLPPNVECYPMFKPSVKKDYYNIVASFMTSDCWPLKKQNEGQKIFFFSHGGGGLKSVEGKMIIPDDIDYILLQSENYAPIQAKEYSLMYPSERLLYLGYPTHDILYTADGTEIRKVTKNEYNKIIIWMPTFRKGAGRNDSTKDQPLGIPLLDKIEQYEELNQYMYDNNSLLIIKLHPMQDIEDLKIKTLSNIEVLSGDDVKKKDIDNYRLLPCTDALISDYSSIAFEYLQLNKPIGYVLEDMEEYKLGFVVEDIDTLLAGEKILTFEDLLDFVRKVVMDYDEFVNRRQEIRDYIYKYHDGKSCERIANFMGLKKAESSE